MRSSRISSLCFLLFLCCNYAFSQNYPSRHYTAAGELPNNAVRSLLVDSNNILWIGTENGIVKKENEVFSYFFEEDGLALNSCWAIAEDKNRNLWFGSYGGGLSFYDGFKFTVISTEEGLVHNEITSLFARGSLLYVGTSNGISVIDIDSQKVLFSDIPPVNGLFRVVDFIEAGQEVYLVTYNSGIYKIEDEESGSDLVKVNDHKFIYSVLVDKDSLYSSNKGFYNKIPLADYVTKGGSEASEKLGESVIFDYVISRDERVFAAAWGIFENSGGIFELRDGKMLSRASEFSVASREVISLAYDADFEKIYIGTKDAGLFEIALNPQIKFTRVNGRKVIGSAETEQSAALLLQDVLILLAGEKEQAIPLKQFKEWQEQYLNTTTHPLPQHQDDFYELDHSNQAQDISFYDIKEEEGYYWVNSNIGIFALEDSGKLHRYLPLHSEEINFTPTGKLIETNPYGGLRVYSDLDDFKYTHFPQEDPHTPTMVVSSLQKGNRTYLLSIFSGLYVYENGRFTSYLHSGIWKEKKLKYITDLGETLAISNEFGDVFLVRHSSSFEVLEKIPRAGFRGNSISFLDHYQGNLIIGTEKGVTLYNKERSIFLDKEQGLEQPLFTAAVKNDSLYIGGENGFYTVNLNAVTQPEPLVNELKIQEVFINNHRVSLDQISKAGKLDLAYNENNILLKFGTNAHPYPNKLNYQFRLNKNEQWSLPSLNPEIFLPFLSSGNHQIQLKVLDESTGLSYSQAILELAVHPPFWKTWWFAALALGMLLLAVFSFYKFQIKQNQKFEEQKTQIQKRFEETRMEALLAQMNPHFIFNAMNSIQYYILDRDIENATIFLGEFAKLIRLNLDHCTKQNILLIEEIEYLQSYIRVENTRFNDAINVVIDLDPEIDPYDIEIPTMLLQTFVENVFVHAFPASVSNPTLRVSFKMLSEDSLECRIEDNGIGFSPKSGGKLHKSRGVILVKERLSLLGYDVEKAVKTVSSGQGTSIRLLLKV